MLQQHAGSEHMDELFISNQSLPLMSLMVVHVDVKHHDYLLTTAYTGDPPSVQLRNATTATTYQKNISCLILDGEVRLQDVEVKGGRQQTAVTAPFLPLAQQESVANPRLNQVVDSVRLGFCGETDASLHALRQQRRSV